MLRYHWKGLTLLGVVLFLCLSPSDHPNTFHVFTGTDKVVHFLMYATLAWVHLAEFRNREYYGHSRKKIALLILVLGLSVGMGVEYAQRWLDWGRDFDWFDELANALGLLTGLWMGNRLGDSSA